MTDTPINSTTDEAADEALSPAYVRAVVDAVDRGDRAQARELVLPLRPADTAELL